MVKIKPKKGKNKAILGIIGLIIAILLLVILFMFLKIAFWIALVVVLVLAGFWIYDFLKNDEVTQEER